MKCLTARDDAVLVGCSDGGLRLLHMDTDGHLDPTPKVWEKLSGKSSPGLSCVCIANPTNGHTEQDCFDCVVGGEDGSLTAFQLKRTTHTS